MNDRRLFFADSRAGTQIWLFGALLALEFWVFQRGISQFHAWVYPRWNDQIQYLTESYTSYEVLRQHGWWEGLRTSLTNPAAQGTLHDFLAVLVFGLVGPSRLAALSLNFLAFAAWQTATFAAWRRLTGTWAIAWLSVALLLTFKVLVEPGPGSPVDFRLDWLGCCMTGLALTMGAFTEGLRHRCWSLAFGALVGVAIISRFLTIVYFGGVLLVLLTWLLFRLPAHDRTATARRLVNLLLATALAAAICLPILWANRDWVYNYYWIGHLTGPESAIRSPDFGVARSIDFIFRDALVGYHLGDFALVIAGAVTAVLAALAATRRWWNSSPPSEAPSARPLARFAGLAFLLVLIPGTVLVLHSQKSHLVVGILLPGIAALTTSAWAGLGRLVGGNVRGTLALALVAVATGAAGAWHYYRGLSVSPHQLEFVASAHKVNALADYIHATARAAKIETPRIGVDQVTDSLDAQITRVVTYERHGVWVPFMMTLPTGIAEDRDEHLFRQLADSDFVFLTDEMSGEGTWPFDRQMRRLYPRLKAWCEANLRRVEVFTLFDRQMSLYQRKEFGFTPPS